MLTGCKLWFWLCWFRGLFKWLFHIQLFGDWRILPVSCVCGNCTDGSLRLSVHDVIFIF